MGRRLSPLALAALAVGVPAAADPPKPRDLAAVLAPIREAANVPAMGGAILAGDRLVAVGVDGVRMRGSKERVTVSDRWHLGSCTKAMTATLCAILVEEGKLTWDRTLPEAFPDLAKSMDAGWKKATLAHLLSHRAGAPADLDADGLWGRLWAHRGPAKDARRILLEGVLSRPPVNPVGTRTLYSNAGVSIAGAMAEVATGKAYEDLMVERLFKPLGMDSAGFGAPGEPGRLDQPRGHRPDGTPVEPGPAADNPPAISPAGRVHASLADWAKFVAVHVGRSPRRLVKAETLARLHEKGAPDSDHAMGWVVTERPWGGGTVLTHSGSNTMWFCTVWIAPEKGFAVLATCNQGGDAAAKACDEAAGALVRDAHEHGDDAASANSR